MPDKSIEGDLRGLTWEIVQTADGVMVGGDAWRRAFPQEQDRQVLIHSSGSFGIDRRRQADASYDGRRRLRNASRFHGRMIGDRDHARPLAKLRQFRHLHNALNGISS